MRLLFFAHAFLPIVGGAERFLDRLAREMCARGHDVRVLAARVRGQDNRVDAPYRLLRYPKPFSRKRFARHTVAYLWRATLGWRPDCVHVQSAYPPGYSAALFCHWKRLPWAVRPVGGDVLAGERIQDDPVLRERVRRSLLRATRVVAQSVELEDLLRSLGVPHERLTRIPNGVDLPGESGREPQDETTVAALGMLFRKKGFDVLIDAFREVRERVPTARLVIAGEGGERSGLEDRVRAHHLEACVELPGVLDEPGKRRLLERASLFVSSSRREPFSNANLEALAAGLPIVATDVGGNREMIDEGQNGFLVPPEDPRALAAAIVRLLKDRALAAKLGRAARERARSYSWRTIGDRYADLYQTLASASVEGP
jgi:glycosyltransferase involved in cell wall biosynthesis